MAQPTTRLYETESRAAEAAAELRKEGFDGRIHVVGSAAAQNAERSDDLVASLERTGVSRDRALRYAEAIRRGHALVAVSPMFGSAQRAIRVLDGFNPIDEGADSAAANGLVRERAPRRREFETRREVDTRRREVEWTSADVEAAPFSRMLGLPVLIDDPAPFSRMLGLPLLIDRAAPFSHAFGLPLLSRSRARDERDFERRPYELLPNERRVEALPPQTIAPAPEPVEPAFSPERPYAERVEATAEPVRPYGEAAKPSPEPAPPLSGPLE